MESIKSQVLHFDDRQGKVPIDDRQGKVPSNHSMLRLFIDFDDRFSFNDSQFGRYTPGTIRSFKTVRTRDIILDLIVIKLKITSTKNLCVWPRYDLVPTVRDPREGSTKQVTQTKFVHDTTNMAPLK